MEGCQHNGTLGMVWPTEMDIQMVFPIGTELCGDIEEGFIHMVGFKEGADGNGLLSSAERVLGLLLSCSRASCYTR